VVAAVEVLDLPRQERLVGPDDRVPAFAVVDESVKMSQGNAEALYYQALARLQTGDTDGAIDALVDAVAADEQYRQFIETDPDVQQLKDTERFVQLLPAS